MGLVVTTTVVVEEVAKIASGHGCSPVMGVPAGDGEARRRAPTGSVLFNRTS